MAELTQAEIDALVGKLKKFPYLCSVGVSGSMSDLGPLKEPPKCEPDTALKDVTLYESGGDVQASFLTKNNVKLTITTQNVDAAIDLLEAFKKGDNIFASANKKTITLVPITTATEKTITFSDAYLQPGLSFTPGAEDDPSAVSLVYICKPDATTGKPFTFGAASVPEPPGGDEGE